MVHTNPHASAEVPRAQVGQRILRATGALMLIKVFLLGFGYIEKRVISIYFGAESLADVYFAARRVAFVVFEVFDQVIMHSFLPVFVQRMREHGERDAWKLASTTLNLLLIILALIAAGGIFFTPEVLRIFLPGWFSGPTGEQSELIRQVIPVTQVMLAAMVFLATSSLTYCLLNSYKQFALPASADLVLKGTVLVFAVLLAKNWGPVALAAGFCCGALGKVLVHLVGLSRRMSNYRPSLHIQHPGLKQFGVLALPLIAGVAFSQLRKVMDTRFTSDLAGGSLSALDFAKALCDIPVQFFPFVFGIALFPFLADIASAGDRQRLREMLMAASRMMFIIFIPLALTFIVLRFPIIYGLYGSEKFGEEAVRLTAAPFTIFAIGMLIGALEIIILQFFFAMADTLRPTLVGMAMVPLHIAVGYLGVYHFQLGATAIAIALFVSKGTKVVVLYGMIRSRLGDLGISKLMTLLGKMAISLIPFVLIIFTAAYFLPGLLPPPSDVESIAGKLIALLPYGVTVGIGMLFYFALLYILRVEEISLLIQRIRGKLRNDKKPELPTPAEPM
ncbi:MAG: putative peptidoglycan biosynthesis protein MurJ [bacterium ADurb.Bin429]|nr:MAG: putative peptidoglycan biosynthesis protein MurJ [bacterium ADurb.Bin429]